MYSILIALSFSLFEVHSFYTLITAYSGHPIFPCLLSLGGKLTLRSNWPVYTQEMTTALTGFIEHFGPSSYHHLHTTPDKRMSDISAEVDRITITTRAFSHPQDPMTLFEKKYGEAGLSLYEIHADLGCRDLRQRTAFLEYLSSPGWASYL